MHQLPLWGPVLGTEGELIGLNLNRAFAYDCAQLQLDATERAHMEACIWHHVRLPSWNQVQASDCITIMHENSLLISAVYIQGERGRDYRLEPDQQGWFPQLKDREGPVGYMFTRHQNLIDHIQNTRLQHVFMFWAQFALARLHR